MKQGVTDRRDARPQGSDVGEQAVVFGAVGQRSGVGSLVRSRVERRELSAVLRLVARRRRNRPAIDRQSGEGLRRRGARVIDRPVRRAHPPARLRRGLAGANGKDVPQCRLEELLHIAAGAAMMTMTVCNTSAFPAGLGIK